MATSKAIKEIYFIRHGETDWNAEKRLQGDDETFAIDLNKNGISQSVYTGKYLNDYRQMEKSFDTVFSSYQQRAVTTANIIKKEIGYDGETIIVNELKEMGCGTLTGTTEFERETVNTFKLHNVLSTKHLTILDPIEQTMSRLKNEEHLVTFYGIESRVSLIGRAQRALDKIIQCPGEKIIVITHGALMATIFSLIGNTFEYNEGKISKGSNCSIGYVKYEEGKFTIVTNPNVSHFDIYRKLD
jgi:broad specificity phosphatase PhoE